MCFIFFSGDKPERGNKMSKKQQMFDKYQDNANTWQIPMKDAPCKGQPCCCISTLPWGCACCAQYKLRGDALNQVGNGMTDYICGQGYYPACLCFRPGQMGEKSMPEVCLCCEVVCCPGMASSATKFLVMDAYQIMPDPCDNKIIAFSNCLQIAACICNILAIFIEPLREAAQILDCIADAVFFSTLGCMAAQVDAELKYQLNKGAAGAAPAPPIATAPAGGPSAAEHDEKLAIGNSAEMER